MKLFRKREINPYSVSDKAVFRNVDRTLTLYVRADAAALMVNLKKAQNYIAALTDESTDEEKRNGARMMAAALFGNEQAERLLEFYPEPLTVLVACTAYFVTLAPKITKAQKK